MFTHNLVTLIELSDALGMPARWLRQQAEAGAIPYLRVGRRRFFNLSAVRQTLARRAAQHQTHLQEVSV